MNVFWRFGYEHTSLDILMREMRIARQSLYDTFGDKRALYLKALRQYRDNDHLRLRRLFASGQSVKWLCDNSVWYQQRIAGGTRAGLPTTQREYGARCERQSHRRVFARQPTEDRSDLHRRATAGTGQRRSVSQAGSGGVGAVFRRDDSGHAGNGQAQFGP